jgi:glycosyltransferase involved in cell wall biosynthesis
MALTYASADKLIAVSQHCAAAMRKDIHRDIDVIHNWVDTDVFAPRPREKRRGAAFRLLFVGNPSPWKAADVLAPLARALGADFEVMAMGGLRKGFAPDARSMPANLRVLDSRLSSGMPDVYASVDAALVVSRYESFGYVALEAMASGLPVVGFDNTGTREVCLNGETALLGPTDDLDTLVLNCQRLASHPGLVEKLSQAGRDRAMSQFSERDALVRYIAVYRDAIDQQKAKK